VHRVSVDSVWSVFCVVGERREVNKNDGVYQITKAMKDDVKDLKLQPYNPFNGKRNHHHGDD